MSRAVGGAFIFEKLEKTVFLAQMRKAAKFCGIWVLGFSIMGNHYHMSIRIPGKIRLSDKQFKRRIKCYYGEGSREYKQVLRQASSGGEGLRLLKERYMKRIADLSSFQKMLKQSFSIWYNGQKNRKGTLWMERFKSTLVQMVPTALTAVAAYIDLNAVRAGMVTDPKDYPFCSYGLALVGDRASRGGLLHAMGSHDWEQANPLYREFMLIKGSRFRQGACSVDQELLKQTISRGGKLTLQELLHLRNRYICDGLILGRSGFVLEQMDRIGGLFRWPKDHTPQLIREAESLELRVLGNLRSKRIG